jgi:hypothetical protein
MKTRTLLRVGFGGWMRFEDPDWTVYVRLEENEATGRYEAVDVLLSVDSGIDASMLRNVPLTMIVTQANGSLRDALEDGMQRPGPNLRLAATAMQTRHMNLDRFWKAEHGQRRGDWIDEMILSQYDADLGIPRARPREPLPPVAGPRDIEPPATLPRPVEPPESDDEVVHMHQGKVIERPSRRPSAKLRIPVNRPYPDSFYRNVADVYERITSYEGTSGAAEAIAKANDVPPGTVRSWLHTARKKAADARTKAAIEKED